MQESWLGSLGKILLWLGGGLFAIVLIIYGYPEDPDLAAWRDFLALLFLVSVMAGTALVVTDRELGGRG